MHQFKNLSEALIRKFTGFHNPEYKKKMYALYRDIFVFAQLCGGAGRKMKRYRKKLPPDKHTLDFCFLHPIDSNLYCIIDVNNKIVLFSF